MHEEAHEAVHLTADKLAADQRSQDQVNLAALAVEIKTWGKELGFADLGIADIDLSHAESGLQAWLDAGHHGEMAYMAAHGMKRARPGGTGAGHGAGDLCPYELFA